MSRLSRLNGRVGLVDLASGSLRDRLFGRLMGRRAAAVCAIAYLTSPQNTVSGTELPVPFAAEYLDSDDIHSNSGATNFRHYIPVGFGGVWEFTCTLFFAANTAGSRQVRFYLNGVLYDQQTIPAVQSGATVVNLTTKAVMLDGAFMEVRAYQDSGATLALAVTSKFSAYRLGDRMGPGDYVSFSSDFKYKGTSRFGGVINGQNIEYVDDPVLGPSRQIIRVTTHSYDNQVFYPRTQLQTPSSYASGADIYAGFGVYIPNEFPVLSGSGNAPILHEFYGPPNNGTGPTVLRILNDSFVFAPGELWPGSVAWSAPVLRGQWVYFVVHVKLSNDPAVGFAELWMNTGSGLVQQTLSGSTKRFYATIATGVNDGGNNYGSLKLAYTDPATADKLQVYFTDYKITTTFAPADPLSWVG